MVQVNPPAGGTTTPAAGVYQEPLDSVVALTAMPSPGYAFVNWTGSVAAPASPSTAIVMSTQEFVTANFAPVTCVNNLSGRYGWIVR
jgi:hypothetical protein